MRPISASNCAQPRIPEPPGKPNGHEGLRSGNLDGSHIPDETSLQQCWAGWPGALERHQHLGKGQTVVEPAASPSTMRRPHRARPGAVPMPDEMFCGPPSPAAKNRSPAYSRTSSSSLSSFRMPQRRRYISPIRHSCGVITPADPRVPHHRVTQAALAPLEGEAEDSGRSWRPLWRAIRRRWRRVRRDHCTST